VRIVKTFRLDRRSPSVAALAAIACEFVPGEAAAGRTDDKTCRSAQHRVPDQSADPGARDGSGGLVETQAILPVSVMAVMVMAVMMRLFLRVCGAGTADGQDRGSERSEECW